MLIICVAVAHAASNRHEIAFVFGQLLSPHSVPCLLQVLQDANESEMVRHEAAEALGGIATPEVFPYLKEYMTKPDVPVVVQQSCQVALDMYEVSSPCSSPCTRISDPGLVLIAVL